MARVLGLAALARCGKDTVAGMLLENEGVDTYAFADPLKVGCQSLFGLTHEQTWSDDIKETPIELWQRSPREMFQSVGTEWMRKHNPKHWLMRAELAIDPSREGRGKGKPTEPNLDDEMAPFKLAAQAFYDLTDEQTWDASQAQVKDAFWGMAPQEMVELIHRNAMTDYPDYFAQRAQNPIALPTKTIPDYAPDGVIVMKDIRFENEADFVREHNGSVWHIVREDAQRVNAHSSENGVGVQPGDVVIDNNGTLEQLAQTVGTQWQALTGVGQGALNAEEVSAFQQRAEREAEQTSPTKGIGM